MKRPPILGQTPMLEVTPTGEVTIAPGLLPETSRPLILPVDPEDRGVDAGYANYYITTGEAEVAAAAAARIPRPRSGSQRVPRQHRNSGNGPQLGEESSVGLDAPWGSERRQPLSDRQRELNDAWGVRIHQQFDWQERDKK